MNADPFIATFQQWIDIFMHRSLRKFIHFARENGLSMSMIGTLFHLSKKGCAGVTDLGDHDPTDRRVKKIVLTEKGHHVLDEGVRARHGWLDDLVEILSQEEKELIKKGLDLLINKANQLEDLNK